MSVQYRYKYKVSKKRVLEKYCMLIVGSIQSDGMARSGDPDLVCW